jgi:GntR family transcriptional regulator
MADPMYRQIAEDLRRQIEAGELAPGAQLQTELELRERYDASRNTVRDAIKWLITRGLVETRPGQGTFVVEKIVPFMTTLTGDPETSSGEGDTYTKEVASKLRIPADTTPQVGIQHVNAEMARELHLDPNASVVSRHQQRFIDGTPWSLQTSFYPLRLVERGATSLIQAGNIDVGTVAYLREELGIKQAGYHDTITVRAPDETETRFFRLPDDGRISVIETRRTTFSEDGTPIRLTVSVYPADRNQFAVNVGLVPIDVADPPSAEATEPAAASEPGSSEPESSEPESSEPESSGPDGSGPGSS